LVVIGGGLAGSEAAWQAAQRSVSVTLYEMRPQVSTPAHVTDRLAELVCSNSLGSDLPDRAAGLLKAELRRLGSLILECAQQTAVPAGGALAVDRDAFAELVTERVASHPLIRLVRQEMPRLPEGPCIVASGPLTSPSLSEDIARLGGEEHLYFYDALAPIVAAESIDMSIAFRASRFGRGEDAEGDYINCPLNREEYARFIEALTSAERIALRDFERTPIEAGVSAPTAVAPRGRSRMEADPLTSNPQPPICPDRFAIGHELTCGNSAPSNRANRPNPSPITPDTYFEGCLPIEVLASRGLESLAFGPMRPIGLYDPRSGRRPHAVVQLRQDNLAGTLYNIVGFQTNLTWPEQKRVLRMIPGLEKAEFVRYGQMHRNTFINAPKLLEPTLQFRGRADLFFAGQITGVEGYMGNAATGLLAGVNAAHLMQGKALWSLPQTTMLGALCWYVTHAEPGTFQPMKANFGLLPPLASTNGRKLGKRDRGAAYAGRALADLERYLSDS
jgi:methylenetetrahydrofolate--tRNA-(uracil-5-)-methyltransferase